MKIISTFFLIILLLIITNFSFAQQQSDTSKVLVTFSEPMSLEGIFDINNYSILKEDKTPVKIYKVGVVPGDSVIVLFTEKQSSSKSYKLIINNLKDKSGNVISESHKMVSY
jgi:hypothetical protein